ncbi:VPS35 endosomal protein-sorting factor-like [Acropora cervicornis]|uniref:VPS35 endosomal protein-sorting factor-like n=1 Tax=Acropora cervicornis TaxID=6130 RepID=A0AAD9QN61_ACRCE|nr:VPS35 endosomal protein-sorting factor-like [Acropora cervicornis]
MAACEWVARTRNYGKEQRQLSFEAVSDHPLKPTAVITRESSTPKKSSLPLSGSSSSAADPLSTIQTKADAFEGLDPLSMFAAQEVSSKLPATTPVKKNERSAEFDKVKHQDDFFEPWSSKRSGILAKYTTSEKLSITTSFLSSSDKDKYVIKQQTTVTDKVKHRLEELDDLEEALINAWETDQRVKALKIAIQCAKLLADVSVIQFYPSKFVLITDILDTFGKLVYERIFRKSSTFSPGSNLPTMLPEFSQALVRLTKIIRGMGDPLVAVYARTYICRLQSDTVQNTLAEQQLEMPQYLQLYPPALDWILQCIAQKSPESTISDILDRCKEECNSALLLNSIVTAFKPEYIAERALQFTELIRNCEEAGFPKANHHLYKSLGQNLSVCDPPEAQRLQILSEVWKVVTKMKKPVEYISCAEAWIEYVCKHFTKREVNTLIGDVIKHMTPDRAFEQHYLELQSIMSKMLEHIHDFSILVSMDKFLPFLDMFQKEGIKVDVCKLIMEAFAKHQQMPTNDPVVVNALLALTVTDERRIIGHLITGFLHKIDFGRDFEKQLDSFVDARSSFSNLETVLVMLVQSVNLLAMRTREVVKGNHTRKTASFIRACVAYCFITIPSIEDIFMRLKLYLLSADAFFQASISLISEAPRTIEIDHKMKPSEPYLLEYLNNFFSTLLVVPDSPDQGALHLVRGLLNVVQDYSWELSGGSKMSVYLNAVSLLSAMIDSNDKLYGCDKKFLAEINQIVSTLIEAVLEHLKSLTSGTQKTSCSSNRFFQQIRSLEYVKQKGASGNKELAAMALKMKLQTRA